MSADRHHHIFQRLIDKCRNLEPIAVAIGYPLSDVALRGAIEGALEGLIRPVLIGPEKALRELAQLFKENRLAKGEFVGLGRKLSLKDIRVPVVLLAGAHDRITTQEQVFSAEALHIGLFMGAKTLRDAWPEIGRWMRAHDRG